MTSYSRFAAYYASHSVERPQVSLGPLVALTGGWASGVYTFALQSPESGSADAETLVLKTYAPTARGHARAAREWQALTRLRAVDYPVSRVNLFEPDDLHLGCPFMVMEHVPGRLLWDVLQDVDQSTQDRLTRLFVTCLVDLHAFDPQVLEPAMTQAHPYAFIERELGQLRRDSQRSHIRR